MNKIVVVDVDFLNSLMKVKGLSESDFAQTIGVSHSMVNRVLNGKRGAGNKFIFGILNTFTDVSYGQLIKHERQLPKGNRHPKKSA
jgi:transcriptional regulator with XRE-family HTH domain